MSGSTRHRHERTRRLHAALKPFAATLATVCRRTPVLDGMPTDTVLALGMASAALDRACTLLDRDLGNQQGAPGPQP